MGFNGGVERARAFFEEPEGHKRALVTRIIKVCSNERVRETLKCRSDLCLTTAAQINAHPVRAIST